MDKIRRKRTSKNKRKTKQYKKKELKSKIQRQRKKNTRKKKPFYTIQKGSASSCMREEIFTISVLNNKFSENLYNYFMELKLNPKHDIINFISEEQGNKTFFKFKSFNHSNYTSTPTWSELQCKDKKLKSGLKIKTDCISMKEKKYMPESLGFNKVFVKGKKNLYFYIDSIQKGKITKDNHIELFNILLEKRNKLGKNLINHNTDVNTLHFKFT